MRSYEFTAKTVDKAIKLGLETLGKKQEDVDIQIISEGGFLKKAKVVIKIEDEPIKTFETKKEESKIETEKANEVFDENINQENAEVIENNVQVEEFTEPKIEEPKTEKVEDKTEKINIVHDANDVKPDVKEKVDQQVQKKEIKNQKKSKYDYVVPTQEELEEKRRKFAETHFEDNKTSVEFVEGLLKVLKIDGKVTLEEKRDNSFIVIETEDAGKVIGYRGDSLSAIQYLANIIESNQNPNAKRVVIDSGNYKERREESLRALAIKVAGKVGETGRAQKLEPMDAYERRIVHTELQNYPSVETHSEGVEPFRRIVVTKKRV